MLSNSIFLRSVSTRTTFFFSQQRNFLKLHTCGMLFDHHYQDFNADDIRSPHLGSHEIFLKMQNFTLFKEIVVKYTSCKIKHLNLFQEFSSVMLHSPYCATAAPFRPQNSLHLAELGLGPHQTLSPECPLPQPPATPSCVLSLPLSALVPLAMSSMLMNVTEVFIRHLSCCDWPISLSIMSLRLILIVVCVGISISLKAEQYSLCVQATFYLFIYQWTLGLLLLLHYCE